MRKHTKVLLVSSTLITSFAVTPGLLAHDGREHGMTGPNGMMNRGGTMGRCGMMRTMGSMMRMMEHCNQMMTNDSRRPNDQWKKTPAAPEEKS